MIDTEKNNTARKLFADAANHALSVEERSQLERKELARGAWREGKVESAILILETVKSERMSPRVAGEVFVTESAFRSEVHDYAGSLESLNRAALFIDACGVRVQGSFYLQRGLAHRRLGNIDAALTDYAGALACYETLGDSDYTSSLLINLSELYLKSGDAKTARSYIDRAFELLDAGSTHPCNAYDTLANVLMAEGSLVKAWSAAERALALAGDNEGWRNDCISTRDRIKVGLMEFMVPIAKPADLEKLKIDVVRHALQIANGSTVEAAKMLETSHQVVAYTAEKHGLARKPARKKSIIKGLS